MLDFYQNKFRYIHVDEYQDTNHAQYVLCRHVGGRTPQHLRRRRQRPVDLPLARRGHFATFSTLKKIIPKRKTIMLEQNYRSTGNILDAANGVISHNVGRKPKKLWTDRAAGRKFASTARRFRT